MLDRKVAIKLVRPVTSAAGEPASVAQARILREAQAMAHLAHPNVIAIFGDGTCDPAEVGLAEGRSPPDDWVFPVRELVPGPTFDAWLKEERSACRPVETPRCTRGCR